MASGIPGHLHCQVIGLLLAVCNRKLLVRKAAGANRHSKSMLPENPQDSSVS